MCTRASPRRDRLFAVVQAPQGSMSVPPRLHESLTEGCFVLHIIRTRRLVNRWSDFHGRLFQLTELWIDSSASGTKSAAIQLSWVFSNAGNVRLLWSTQASQFRVLDREVTRSRLHLDSFSPLTLTWSGTSQTRYEVWRASIHSGSMQHPSLACPFRSVHTFWEMAAFRFRTTCKHHHSAWTSSLLSRSWSRTSRLEESVRTRPAWLTAASSKSIDSVQRQTLQVS